MTTTLATQMRIRIGSRRPLRDDAEISRRSTDVAEMIPCGPQPKPHVEAIRRFVQAGYDHVAVVQAGRDQAGFLRFWEEEPRPKLD